MGFMRLAVCVSGVYSAFLLWAIAQERLSSPFFPASSIPAHDGRHPEGEKFPSPLFFNFAQALASAVAAVTYLVFGAWKDGSLSRRGVLDVLGLKGLLAMASESEGGKDNGQAEGKVAKPVSKTAWYRTLPALLLQVSLFQTTAGPIGFLSLRHISYPTMVLGKSCKLIPVLVLNVVLYRRRFSTHKYLVVALVTVGITLFMFFGESKKRGSGGDSVWGLTLLGINLLIDGLTNSTQDQIFSLYPRFSGQQMMFIMAFMTLLVLLPAMVVPLPTHPFSLINTAPRFSHIPLELSPPVLTSSIRFVLSHPTSIAPLAAYALLGGLGQIFIFETIQHFGSLTLVMVTVTRKLFTMLLSVVVFHHHLAPGQWAGVAVVFAGIGVEAAIKRRDVLRRARRD